MRDISNFTITKFSVARRAEFIAEAFSRSFHSVGGNLAMYTSRGCGPYDEF